MPRRIREIFLKVIAGIRSLFAKKLMPVNVSKSPPRNAVNTIGKKKCICIQFAKACISISIKSVERIIFFKCWQLEKAHESTMVVFSDMMIVPVFPSGDRTSVFKSFVYKTPSTERQLPVNELYCNEVTSSIEILNSLTPQGFSCIEKHDGFISKPS